MDGFIFETKNICEISLITNPSYLSFKPLQKIIKHECFFFKKTVNPFAFLISNSENDNTKIHCKGVNVRMPILGSGASKPLENPE